MVFGAIYFKSTGMIKMFCNGPDEDFLHLQVGDDPDLDVYVGQIDMKTHYLPGGVPTERPVMPMTGSIAGEPVDLKTQIQMTTSDDLHIIGIPEGTKLYYPGGVVDSIDDFFIEWGSESPGEYTLQFHNQPFQEVILHAKVG